MWVWVDGRAQFIGEIPATNNGLGRLSTSVRNGEIYISWPVCCPRQTRTKILTLDGIRLRPLNDTTSDPDAAPSPSQIAAPVPSAQAEEQDDPYPPTPGDVDVLGGDATGAACWPSKDALDLANQAMVASDDDGFQELVVQYHPLALSAGTHVRILDDEPFAGHIEVRVLGGVNEGVACWYPFVDKSNKDGNFIARRFSAP